MDIGESVKVVDLLARQSYREHQLEPFLSKLKEEADNTVTLIGDLNESLKCESLFRSVIVTMSVIFKVISSINVYVFPDSTTTP